MARDARDGMDTLAALAANANFARMRNTSATGTSHKRRGTVMSISMSQEDARFVREAAASHGLPVSAYVRLACREFERQHS